MTINSQLKQMASNAKQLGFSRNKAFRHAPIEEKRRKIFMDEYDRYQPRTAEEMESAEYESAIADDMADEDYCEGRA